MENLDDEYDSDDKYGTSRAPDEDQEGGYELWTMKLFLQACSLFLL